jgi:hypothetical protein
VAHFYGTVQGARGEASRLGNKASGLQAIAASYSGAVEVELQHRDGVDYARVCLRPWMGEGVDRVLFDGPVSGGSPR